MFASVPEKTISSMLEFLIDKTYVEHTDGREKSIISEFAENKLFGFVETLQKVKRGETGRPGYTEEGSLWIYEINKLL
jgi:hypothetical protein